ncbi:MAG: tetratricopeptide repeat protein [Chlorobiaceae bacterium]
MMKGALTPLRLALCIIGAISAFNPSSLWSPHSTGNTTRTNNFSAGNTNDSEGNSICNNNNLAAIEKALRLRDWEATKNNLAFRNFVPSRYGEDVEQLKTCKMASFWEDLLAYFDETKKAESLYRRAVAILEKSLGPDHPNTLAGQRPLNMQLDEMKQKVKDYLAATHFSCCN